MVTRRNLLTAAGAVTLGATTGAVAGPLAPGAAMAADVGRKRWTRRVSANGWPIDPDAVSTHRIEGAGASVALRGGVVAAVLLHVARRWHYEIAPLDTGEGGGVVAHTAGLAASRVVGADFESNYLSGTAVALHPSGYPLGGSEPLWPHHELIVRDILVDCAGTVVWGGDLSPRKGSHFHIVARPGDRKLAGVAARLDPGHQVEPGRRAQTAGFVADPATPQRRAKAAGLPRPR